MQAGHNPRVPTRGVKAKGVARALPKPRVKRKFIKSRALITLDGSLVVHIGIRTRNPENGGRMHWGEKATHKEKFEKAVRDAARPLAVTSVTFIRWSPGVGFDDDSLPVSFKWFRDAACKWLGLPNDSPTCGVAFKYEQHKQPEYGITLRFR